MKSVRLSFLFPFSFFVCLRILLVYSIVRHDVLCILYYVHVLWLWRFRKISLIHKIYAKIKQNFVFIVPYNQPNNWMRYTIFAKELGQLRLPDLSQTGNIHSWTKIMFYIIFLLLFYSVVIFAQIFFVIWQTIQFK